MRDTTMSQREKLLNKMRNNPRNWRIEDLKALAGHYGITYDQTGSHVTFRSPGGRRATVPAHKPIKPVYISKFLELIGDK
jgi:HicA toxin of bacterial toxin-antitoxin,